MTTTRKTLPKKPSALIRLALADLRKIERRPQYKVDMAEWHTPYGADECHVCLAGAVMVCELGAQMSHLLFPYDFDHETKKALRAINTLRAGNIDLGLQDVGYEENPLSSHRVIATYSGDRHQFYRDMRKLADDLENEGL